jgi:hypothetical protein
MMSLDDVDVEAVEDELEPEEEAIELVDADGEKVNADQDSAVDTEAESEDEVESSEGASAPKKASGNFSNLSLATVDLDADYSLNVDAEDELIGGSDDVLSEGADAALTDGSGEVLGDGSGDGVPGDLAEDGADAALGDGQGDGSNGAVDEESSGLLDSSTEERGGETSAQVSSVLAQVFFAKGMSEQGTVGASWTEASATASDAGELVSGRLMVQFDGGAQPAQVYAWAVAADGVPQDAGGAWRAAAESGTLVYSSDPAVEAQLLASGDARVGFEYDGDARVGFLTLGDVPSDGLVSDDGTLKIVVCVTDASVQTALQEVAANLGSQLEAQAPVQAGAGVPSRDATLCGTELQALLQRRAEYFVALLAGGGEAAGEDGDAAGAGGGDAAATTEVAEVAEVPVIVEAAADGGDAAAGAGTEGAGTEDNVQAQVAEQAATEAAEVAESAGQSPEQTQSAPAESVADSAGTAVTTETLQVEAAVVEEQGEGFSAGADEAAVEPAAEADAVPVIMDTMPADDNGSGALDAAA